MAGTKSSKPTILIVDRSEQIRRDLASFLEGSGRYRTVGEASNLVQAMELARTVKPEIVLFDVEMAQLDGLDLIRGLRELLPSAALVVAHSDGDEYAAAARAAGAVTVVAKKRLFESIGPALEVAAQSNGRLGSGGDAALARLAASPWGRESSLGESHTMPAGLWWRPTGWREWLAGAAAFGSALVRGLPIDSAPERSYWRHIEVAMVLLVVLLAVMLFGGGFNRADDLSKGLIVAILLVLATAQVRQIRRLSSAKRSSQRDDD